MYDILYHSLFDELEKIALFRPVVGAIVKEPVKAGLKTLVRAARPPAAVRTIKVPSLTSLRADLPSIGRRAFPSIRAAAAAPPLAEVMARRVSPPTAVERVIATVRRRSAPSRSRQDPSRLLRTRIKPQSTEVTRATHRQTAAKLRRASTPKARASYTRVRRRSRRRVVRQRLKHLMGRNK